MSTEQGDSAIFIPAEHPALRDPENHRQPVKGVRVEFEGQIVRLAEGGWIDGPVTIGTGWKVLASGPKAA